MEISQITTSSRSCGFCYCRCRSYFSIFCNSVCVVDLKRGKENNKSFLITSNLSPHANRNQCTFLGALTNSSRNSLVIIPSFPCIPASIPPSHFPPFFFYFFLYFFFFFFFLNLIPRARKWVSLWVQMRKGWVVGCRVERASDLSWLLDRERGLRINSSASVW